MGALEFTPSRGPQARTSQRIQIERLVALAYEVLTHQNDLDSSFVRNHRCGP